MSKPGYEHVLTYNPFTICKLIKLAKTGRSKLAIYFFQIANCPIYKAPSKLHDEVAGKKHHTCPGPRRSNDFEVRWRRRQATSATRVIGYQMPCRCGLVWLTESYEACNIYVYIHTYIYMIYIHTYIWYIYMLCIYAIYICFVYIYAIYIRVYIYILYVVYITYMLYICYTYICYIYMLYIYMLFICYIYIYVIYIWYVYI